MPRCSFCKVMYDFPRGITVVQKDGTPKTFCSKKCRRSSEMGRDNKKVKWVVKNPEAQQAETLVKKEE